MAVHNPHSHFVRKPFDSWRPLLLRFLDQALHGSHSRPPHTYPTSTYPMISYDKGGGCAVRFAKVGLKTSSPFFYEGRRIFATGTARHQALSLSIIRALTMDRGTGGIPNEGSGYAYEGRLTTFEDSVEGRPHQNAPAQEGRPPAGEHAVGYADARAIGEAPLDSRLAGPHILNTQHQTAACRRCGKAFVRPPNSRAGAKYFRCNDCNSTGTYLASVCPFM